MESSDDAIIGTDLCGLVTAWNPAAKAMLGYAAEKIIGQPITRIVPSDCNNAAASIIDRVRRGERIVHLETKLLCKDGRVIPVSLTVSPIGDDQGRLVGAATIAHDLSDMQRTQVDLKRREAVFRSILDTAPDAFIVVNGEGLIQSFSAAAVRLFGYSAEEVVGRNIGALLPAPDWEPHDNYWSLYLVARKQCIAGFGQRKDGSTFPMELVIGEVHGPGTPLYTAFVRDLTEREEWEQEQRAAVAERESLTRHLASARDSAERSNQAKSRFLASMSHELRTPLSGILGYAQLLRAEGELNATQDERVNAMLAAGKHLLEMVTSVLDLSEIEAGHVELRTAAVDPRAATAACLDLVRPTATSKGLALRMVVAPEMPQTLLTDPLRLRQILLNLLGNAVKFTTNGTVEVRIRPAADAAVLRIEVADTGPGISPAQRQRLFRDFERIDAETNTAVEGSGLGLALSTRLASLIDGRLGYSDNPGGGSVFWLELPLGTSTASYPVAAANPVGLAGEVDPAPVQALHALVVDDMAMNRDIASTLLRIAGYKVDCVDSGEAAVAAVAATDFDVVLMDVGMPEMDGLEATRRIRALSGSRGSVPIVALTAHAFKEQVEECRKAGMDGHLTKPFDGNTLVAAVTAAAGHQREPGQLAAAPPTIVPVAHEAIGSELPVLDPPAFERTAAFLAPGMVAAYLRVIEARGEAILRDLHEPDALIRNRNELAKAAHTLAGSVIMFGFGRLAAIGLRFEKAVQSDATELPAIVEALSAAVEATLLEIRTRLPREASA